MSFLVMFYFFLARGIVHRYIRSNKLIGLLTFIIDDLTIINDRYNNRSIIVDFLTVDYFCSYSIFFRQRECKIKIINKNNNNKLFLRSSRVERCLYRSDPTSQSSITVFATACSNKTKKKYTKLTNIQHGVYTNLHD